MMSSKRSSEKTTAMLPGLCICFLLAALATFIEHLPFWPFTLASGQHPFEAVMLAIVLGMLLNSIWRYPETCNPGIKLSAKWMLYIAIMLLGARLDVHQMAHLSLYVLLIIVLAVISSLLMTWGLASMFGIKRAPALLIAMGTAICGSAAIAATVSVIDAKENDVAVSLSAINLLGLVALFVLPFLGSLFHMSTLHYAVWVGSSVQAVPQTVAAAFAYSHSAGLLGTVVKLVRVLMLAPILMVVAWLFHRRSHMDSNHDGKGLSWKMLLPPFIIGFLVMMVVGSSGLLRPFKVASWNIEPQSFLAMVSSFFMAMALAGIGLQTHVTELYHSGKKPLLLATFSAVCLVLVSLLLVHLFL